MVDLLHLQSGILLFSWLNRRMARKEPDEPTEFYDGEQDAYLSDGWRRALDQMRRCEYPIDYDDW